MPLLFIFRLLSLDEYRHLLGKVQRLFLQVRRRYLTCPMDSLMSRYCSIRSIAARAIPIPTTSSYGGAGTDTHRAGGTTAAVQRSSIPINQPVKGATVYATRKRRRGCRGGKLVQSRKSKENDITDNSTTAPPESKKRKISVLHTSGAEDHHHHPHHRIKGARTAEEQGQSNSIDRLWMPFKVPELITVGQRLLDQALKSAAVLERHKEDTSSSSASSRYMCGTELLGSGDTATGTGPIHTGDSSDCPKREGVEWSGEHLRSHLVRTLFVPELIDTTSGCAVRDSGSDDLTWTSMAPSIHDSMKNDGSMLLLSAPLPYLMSQQDDRLSANQVYLDSDHSGMKAHTNSSSKSSSKVDATGTISEDLTPFIPNPSLDLMHDTAAAVDHRSCQVDADYIHSSNSYSNPRYPSSLSSLKKNKRKKVKRKIRTLRSIDDPQQQHATTPCANYPPHPHHIEQLERVDSGISHHLSRPFFTKASDCMDACYGCYRFFAYVCYYVILFVEQPACYLVVLQQHLIIINIIILIHHTLVPIADKRHHSRYTQRAAGRHPSHTILLLLLPESSRRGVGPAVSGHTQQTCLRLRESCV